MPAKLVDYLLQPTQPLRQVQVSQGGPVDPDTFSVGRITKSGRELQLAMLLPVKTSQGNAYTLRTLIDTGAETNLIRQGPLNPFFFNRRRIPCNW